MLPSSVRIVEVGARDGLQNQPNPVSTRIKIELIDRLVAAGVRHIEAGAFVSPKWIPLMADSSDVFAGIQRVEGVAFSALVPNVRGMEQAIAANANEVAVFVAATESFSRRNTNCSIEEAFNRALPIFEMASENGIRVRGYVSCVMGCPYEGDNVDPHKVAELAARLVELGAFEVSLGDTIGRGTPGKTRALVEAVAAGIGVDRVAAHFHNTYGQALANLYAGLELGVSVIDSSVAGLGGCPYAKGATGNVATEDVVYMLHGMGVETGVDLGKLVATARFISEKLGRRPASKLGRVPDEQLHKWI